MTQTNCPKTLLIVLTWLFAAIMPALGQSALKLQLSAPAVQSAPVELSLDALDALEQVEFSTNTIWTDEEATFSGVPLKTLLALLNATGQTVEMIALNDYAVSMPVAELEDNAPIVATRMNGAPMSVRGKGPFWVVYPYDRAAKYQSETAYSRSIWQLRQLRVMD